MNKSERNKLMLRWSIVTAAVIALFWAIYYLATGSVPVVTSVKVTKIWIIEFGFGMSRWWDVLIGPIWSVILITLIDSFFKKYIKKDDLALVLAYGLALSLAFGLTFGLTFGLAFGLTVSLALGLALGLVFGLAYGLKRILWSIIKK